MTPKEKALEIIENMNNGKFSLNDWIRASTYSKSELKRKCLIVVDELIKESHEMFEGQRFTFWNQVRNEIVQL